MGTSKWCIWTAGFLKQPDGERVMDIPLGGLVIASGKQVSTADAGQSLLWSEVVYRDQIGWVYDGYLEDYVEKFPASEVLIPHPTPDPFDAAQYMMVDGNVKRNMCGELCVAFIAHEDIETFLAKWKAASPGYYQWAVGADSDKTSSADALDSMLAVYGHPVPGTRFDAGLRDPVMGVKISPGRLKSKLETCCLIAGVQIDPISGRLRGQGVNHWIVVDKVTPNGINGGWVEIYNPYPNRREEYSYDEFMHSAGPATWNGIWVNRQPGA